MTDAQAQELSRTMRWDGRFIKIAQEIAWWSKDRSRQVGCVIVGPQKDIRASGYNGFARGVDDNVEERHQRPAKYLWTEHAERNAIYNAARFGIPLEGCTIYLPWYPCVDCSRAIIQCGITTVVAVEPDWRDPKYGEEFRIAQAMFNEVKMLVRYVEGKPPTQMAINA
jgi:Deoxycytidylate deaminase